MLKIRVLNVSKKDLLKDLERAAEFDQTALFKKVYEEEYGTFGGAPFGALIGDYEFGNHPQDMALLEKISQVAAAAHAPVHLGGLARAVRLETLHRAGRGARPGQDLRPDRVRQVAVVPRLGGLALRRADPAAHAHAPALRQGHRPGRDVQLRGGRGRQGPQEVPLGERGLLLRDAPHRRVRAVRLVRRDPRRRGRRPRGGAAGPHLPDRRRRRRPEVPDRDRHHRPAREGALGPRLHPARPLQEHRLRGVLRRRSRPRRRRSTTPTPRTRTRASRRSCPTSSPSPASRTT